MSASQQYTVIRTTTDQLEAKLNEVAQDGAGVESFQWVGGRDWIIIARGYRIADATQLGWVADNEVRHARFDASPLAKDGPPDIGPQAYVNLVDPEVEWGDIKYGRYDTQRVPTGSKWSGWIEDHARSWIIFLDEHGQPALYWPRRDAEGGCIGSPFTIG